MKFKINKSTLKPALDVVKSGVSRMKDNYPIISHILISVEASGKIELLSNDMELETKISVQVPESDIAIHGSVAVPGELADIVSRLPDAEITLEHDNSILHVRCGKSRFRLPCLPGSDFPRALANNLDETITLPIKEFTNLLSFTAPAMAKNDVRFFLNGMLLQIASGKLSAVATNGHVMAVANMTVESDLAIDFIIPAKTIDAVLRLPADGNIVISSNKNQVNFASGKVNLLTRVVDGKFPDWSRVATPEITNVSIIDAEKVLSAVQRVTLIAETKGSSIQMTFSDNQVLVKSSNQLRNGEESVEIKCDFSETIGFSSIYMMDALSTLGKGNAIYSMSNPNCAVKLNKEGDENHFWILMPAKL